MFYLIKSFYSNEENLKMYLIISLFVSLLTDFAASTVQSPCEFTKSTGYYNCRNLHLTEIPEIPPETQILDLTNNDLGHLDHGSFNCCSLITELYASNNSLSQIHYSVFQHLNQLRVLDLSHNNLKRFFVDIPVSVEVLFLDHNSLLNGSDIFQRRMQFLRYLSLGHTGLRQVPRFSSFFPVLQYLDVNDDVLWLDVTAEDLVQFKELRVLSISPRLFSGSNKMQKCQEFAKAMKTRKIEVRNLMCKNGKNFQLNGNVLEREYKSDKPQLETSNNVFNAEKPDDISFFDLQNLASSGLTNFFRFLLADQEQNSAKSYKIKQPMKLDDFSIRQPELHFKEMRLNSFPLFNTDKEPLIGISSTDAEEHRRFKVTYKTASNGNTITTLTGIVAYYEKVYTIICDFTNMAYETERSMLLFADFKARAIHTNEKISFEQMKCRYNVSVDRVTEHVISSALTTVLSEFWLDYVINVADAAIIEPRVRNISDMFTGFFKHRTLTTLVDAGVSYLRKLNLNSFDVSPAAVTTFKDNSLETDFQNALYNIKIYNLFNYSNYDLKYEHDTKKDTLNVLMTTYINYPADNAAILAITSKQDPSDVLNFFVNKIELVSAFEIRTINKVRKLRLVDANVRIVENGDKHILFVIQILKKYLNMELSKEFQRSLTFLTNKMDFYSLNGL